MKDSKELQEAVIGHWRKEKEEYFIKPNGFIHRRIQAIKLAWYVLFEELYWEIVKYGVYHLCKFSLYIADKEQQKKGLAGIGRTRGWRWYLKLKNL